MMALLNAAWCCPQLPVTLRGLILPRSERNRRKVPMSL